MDKPLLLGIILAVIIGIVGFGVVIEEYVDSQKSIKNTTVFHVTLADPALYDCDMRLPLFPSDCKYTETVFLEEGMYEFRFVPNGDSPQKLEVRLDPAGKIGFSQKYVLVGNLVEGGMSSWYTWEYQIDPVDAYWADKRTCESCVSIDKWEAGQAKITINPQGNVNGPVSIELVQIK
jgi:hypothetical protein